MSGDPVEQGVHDAKPRTARPLALIASLGLVAAACTGGGGAQGTHETTASPTPAITADVAEDRNGRGCRIEGVDPGRASPFSGVELTLLDAGSESWSLSLGGRYLRDMILADGVLYGSVKDGPVFAMDAATCATNWETVRHDVGSLALSGGDLFTATESAIAAIDAADGMQRWRTFAGDEHVPRFDARRILIADGVLLLPVAGRPAVAGLDAGSGERRFVTEAAGGETLSLAADGDVFVTGSGDLLEIRSAADGGLIGSVALPHRIESVAVNGRVAVAVGGGRVTVVDPDRGEIAWEASLPGPALGAPLVVGDVVYVAGRDGIVRSFDAADGEIVGEVLYPACCVAPPTPAGVVVVNRGGSTTAYDVEGSALWTVATGAGSDGRHAAAVVDGSLAAVLTWTTRDAR